MGAWTFHGQAHFDLNNSIWSWGQNHSLLRVGEGTWELHSNNAGEIICPCEILSRAVSCPWALSPYPWKRARCSHHANQCDFHWPAWLHAHLHHRRMEVVVFFFLCSVSWHTLRYHLSASPVKYCIACQKAPPSRMAAGRGNKGG